ncbi:MAG: four helix bundle protein [Acidobacteria bacterium]|nr:four helix bundle protein [Acidobacteriota bacterium]
MAKSITLEKAIDFALRIVALYKHLLTQKEYVLSKQVLLSGAMIAKHIKTATQSDSRQGFGYEMRMAMQKAAETELWLLLLHKGGYLNDKEYLSIDADCRELIKLTTSITKSTSTDVQ